MKRKRFKQSALSSWSYNNPKMDRKLAEIYKSVKELDDLLAEKKKKGKRKK